MKKLSQIFEETILNDEYFIELFSKVTFSDVNKIFNKDANKVLSDKEYRDLLRFSDILSNGSNPASKNYAYKIIVSLLDEYKTNPYYKIISTAVLSKMGNFPALEYLKNKENFDILLPLTREIEKEYKEIIQKVPGKDQIFIDFQYDLFNKLIELDSLSFSGPTSMGKSFLIKTFILSKISKMVHNNVIVVVPTRALINQYVVDVNRELQSQLELFKYTVSSNSYISSVEGVSPQNFILILTPERLLTFLTVKEKIDIKYLIIDEAHRLGSESKDIRSITLYNAIERTLEEFPDLNIYFASPNIKNPEVLQRLFNKPEGNTFLTTELPVSQNLFFLDLLKKEIFYYSEVGKINVTSDFLNNCKNLSSVIGNIGGENSNMVYCNTPHRCIDAAIEFKENYTFAKDQKVKAAIRKVKNLIHKEYYLVDCLESSIAFHFGNLPQIVRIIIEELFREEKIKYLFCTSTLLEGVNLPAKNIFILSGKKGKRFYGKIDFWNLAGRAGRLTSELSGNIFCIRENESDWKNFDELVVKDDLTLYPEIEKALNSRGSINKIKKILNNDKVEGPEIEILKYVTNILSIDLLDNAHQINILEKISPKYKDDLINLIKEKTKNIEVPLPILLNNKSISIQNQSKVYKFVRKNLKKAVLPEEIKYKTILKTMQLFHELYNWENTEKKFSNINSLNYFSFLANQWVNGFRLKEIIINSIKFKSKRGDDIVYFDHGERITEKFDETNKRHLNEVINTIISQIEGILRYRFQKYLNNYYNILKHLLGEKDAGINWATYLEYGTNDSIVVALQNIGFTRHTALSLVKNYKNCLVIDNSRLIDINFEKLLKIIDKLSPEFDEITLYLNKQK